MATPLPSQPRAINLQNLKTHLLGVISRELESAPLGDDRKGAIIMMIQKAFVELKYNFPTPLKDQVTREILDELLGFGPLQPLLDDPDISEVMVNGHEKVYIERKGKIIRTDITFPNDDAVLRTIDKIIMPLGRRIDADSPTVDARLPDGSRVNAVIPPVAIDGPTITIRKFQKDKLTMEQYINLGTVTENIAEFMRICVLSRLNIIISGGTGSGKTTLLNILSSFISPTERIVTIEDAAELKLQQDHVVRMETKT
ncbi:CpaF family protein, partial [bacterium]|nr:CpaF family protein [bacterium]